MNRLATPFAAALLVVACDPADPAPADASLLPPTSTGAVQSAPSQPRNPIAPGRICPAPAPLAAGADDLRFTEDDFTRERFESSLRFFADELHEQLGMRPDSAKVMTDREGFWITYTNSEQFIEGFVLKQAAEIERLRYPLDSTLARDSVSATGRFCRFVATRQWRD